MKDLLKKIGSLLVCVSLVGSLAACGGSDGGKGGSSAVKDFGQKTAEDAAKTYLSAYTKQDSEAALKVVLEGSELYSIVEAGTKEKQMEDMKKGVPEKFLDRAETIMEKMWDTAAENSSYEIINVKEEDTATVEFSTTTLDLASAQEQAYQKKMEEYSEEELMEMEEDKQIEFELEMMEMAIDIALDEKKEITTNGTLTLEKVDNEWFVSAQENEQ